MAQVMICSMSISSLCSLERYSYRDPPLANSVRKHTHKAWFNGNITHKKTYMSLHAQIILNKCHAKIKKIKTAYLLFVMLNKSNSSNQRFISACLPLDGSVMVCLCFMVNRKPHSGLTPAPNMQVSVTNVLPGAAARTRVLTGSGGPAHSHKHWSVISGRHKVSVVSTKPGPHGL